MKQDKKITLKDFCPLIDTPYDVEYELRQRFINRRKELKLSRQQLSEMSGIDIGVIRRYEESGKITLKNFIELAFALKENDILKDAFKSKQIGSLYE